MVLTPYTEVYSRLEYVTSKIFNLQTVDTVTQTIIKDLYQKYIDELIDTKLRAKLGFLDTNGYEIILPLDSNLTKHEVHKTNNTVKVFLYPQIQNIADDGVVALYRYDTGDATERLERFEKQIDDYLDSVFGITINRALDFEKISPGADVVSV